jgi:hypothetical protein
MLRKNLVWCMFLLLMLASAYPLWFAFAKTKNVIYVCEMLLLTILLSIGLITSVVRAERVDFSGLKTACLISIGIPVVCSISVYLAYILFMIFTGKAIRLKMVDMPLLIVAPIFGLYIKGWIFLLSIASMLPFFLLRTFKILKV